MIPKNQIVFLIRAYNESSRIEAVIRGIFDAGFSQILVVDDGSIDDTEKKLAKNFSEKIFYLRHLINRGGGAAMETGFEFIRRNATKYSWKWLVTFDADGQMDITDMKNFLDFQEKNPEAKAIFGSRFITKTDSNVPFFRKITLFGGRIFTKIISGISLTDAHNWYRMIEVSLLEKIRISMDGMEYASELIDEIYKNHEKIHEVPVNIFYDDYTLAKGQRFGGAVRIARKMLFKKFF